jgi:1,3-beta-glucan synthase
MLCKVTEQVQFPMDFILIHVLVVALLPFMLIPKFNAAHTKLLLWTSEASQVRLRGGVKSVRQKRRRRSLLVLYGVMLVTVVLFCVAICLFPILVPFKSMIDSSTLASL